MGENSRAPPRQRREFRAPPDGGGGGGGGGEREVSELTQRTLSLSLSLPSGVPREQKAPSFNRFYAGEGGGGGG